jgi:alpha-amylase
MADRYAAWLAANPGDVVALGWDFETFGEHHRAETGIFEFLEALPGGPYTEGMTFSTPTEAAARHEHRAPDSLSRLPGHVGGQRRAGVLPRERGAASILFQLMMQAYAKASLYGDPALRKSPSSSPSRTTCTSSSGMAAPWR